MICIQACVFYMGTYFPSLFREHGIITFYIEHINNPFQSDSLSLMPCSLYFVRRFYLAING